MIDLELPSLPDTIAAADGRTWRVRTSFRAWLRFGRVLAEVGVADPSVLADPAGGTAWVPGAVEFYRSPVETPRPVGRADPARSVDLLLDGDYIVGSFQSAYGIDLTRGDMHWHRFLALLRSLPGDSKLAQIGGYRTWREDKRKEPARMAELRRAWALPAVRDAVSAERQAEWFGDVVDRYGSEVRDG